MEEHAGKKHWPQVIRERWKLEQSFILESASAAATPLIFPLAPTPPLLLDGPPFSSWKNDPQSSFGWSSLSVSLIFAETESVAIPNEQRRDDFVHVRVMKVTCIFKAHSHSGNQLGL